MDFSDISLSTFKKFSIIYPKIPQKVLRTIFPRISPEMSLSFPSETSPKIPSEIPAIKTSISFFSFIFLFLNFTKVFSHFCSGETRTYSPTLNLKNFPLKSSSKDSTRISSEGSFRRFCEEFFKDATRNYIEDSSKDRS